MDRVFRRCLLGLFAFVLLGATGASAQTGSITGRVTDRETGAPQPSATVEAVSAAGTVVARAVTAEDGQYRLTNVPPGTYTLVVSLVGFQTERLPGVRVITGETTMVGATIASTAFLLNPLVVSASKRVEKAIDAPARVEVVDARAIAERPVATPVDHLRSVPGVDVVTQGVQSTNVVVRGFNNIFSGALHTLTDNRIAGVPSLRLNAMHFIPVNDEDVDRMEVVLGPGAALYGPNTASGVLHIITRSPLDQQGSTIAAAGGDRSLFAVNFRTAQRLSDNFGIKVSGQYLQADEWEYSDPVEAAERQKYAADPFFRLDLMRAVGIDGAEADRRIALIGNRDFDLRRYGGEARADYRSDDGLSLVFSGGATHVGRAIELTGLGGAQAVDWRYSYLQARANYGRLFVQGYLNASDAGETYLLRNGAPIVDRSKLYVAQVQHGFSLGDRQNFTYGADFIRTDPVTDGTINGKYEDEDQTTEIGGYLQSETTLSPWLSLVLAGRIDDHSALPEAIFSPRAGIVVKPSETQALRFTYNQAFSTPSSLNQFLDLGSAMPDPGAARLGYSLRVQGTGTDGFRFRQGGAYQMRSPFTPDGIGGPATLLPADASLMFAAAVQVVAAQAAAGGEPIDPAMLQYLLGLQPTSTDISTNYLHPATGGMGSLASLDLPDIAPIRETTTTTFEVGYKGVIGDRVLLAADVWHSKIENFVTPLTVGTPLLLLNPQQTGQYLTVRFMTDLGMSQEQAAATATALTQGLAQVPLGVISSPDINANGAQLLATYMNVQDELSLWGTDFSATALLSDNFSLSGTLSVVNENLFESSGGLSVTLNAPKTKGSVALGYRDAQRGLNAELRTRFNDEFPVRSGVYNGTGCLPPPHEPGYEACVSSATLFDVVLGYRLPFQGASLQLSVQNLTDQEYRSFPGVPTIGRMAMLRLKYDF